MDERVNLLLQGEGALYVMPVLLVEIAVLHRVLLGPLTYLFKLVDNVLVLNFQQDLPLGSVQ